MKLPAKYRLWLYIIAAALLAGTFAAGVVTPDQVNAGLDTAAKCVALIAAALAAFNVTPDE